MEPKITVTDAQLAAAKEAFAQIAAGATQLHKISTELGWNGIEDSDELAGVGASPLVRMFFDFVDSCKNPGCDIIHVGEFATYLERERAKHG